MSNEELALISLVVIVGVPVIATAIVRLLVGPSRRHAIMMGLGTLTGPSIGVALSKHDMDSRQVKGIEPPDTFYVGFRDFAAEPPHVTFDSDPRICFQFPKLKPAVLAPGQRFRRVDLTGPFF